MRVFAWICVTAGILFAIASFVLTARAPSVNPWPSLVAGFALTASGGHHARRRGNAIQWDAHAKGHPDPSSVELTAAATSWDYSTAACEIYRGHHDFKSEA